MKLGFFIEEFIFLGISSKKYHYSASGGILKIFFRKTIKIWKGGGRGRDISKNWFFFLLFFEYFFPELFFFFLSRLHRKRGMGKEVENKITALNLLLCLNRRQVSLKSNQISFINIF